MGAIGDPSESARRMGVEGGDRGQISLGSHFDIVGSVLLKRKSEGGSPTSALTSTFAKPCARRIATCEPRQLSGGVHLDCPRESVGHISRTLFNECLTCKRSEKEGEESAARPSRGRWIEQK